MSVFIIFLACALALLSSLTNDYSGAKLYCAVFVVNLVCKSITESPNSKGPIGIYAFIVQILLNTLLLGAVMWHYIGE